MASTDFVLNDCPFVVTIAYICTNTIFIMDEDIKPTAENEKPSDNLPTSQQPVAIDVLPFNPSMNLNVRNGGQDLDEKIEILQKTSKDT